MILLWFSFSYELRIVNYEEHYSDSQGLMFSAAVTGKLRLLLS